MIVTPIPNINAVLKRLDDIGIARREINLWLQTISDATFLAHQEAEQALHDLDEQK